VNADIRDQRDGDAKLSILTNEFAPSGDTIRPPRHRFRRNRHWGRGVI